MKSITESLNQLNLQVVQLVGQGNIEEATLLAIKCVELGRITQIAEHPAIADSINNLAELYRMQGNYINAKLLYIEALNLRKNLLGEQHPDTAQALNNLATFYFSQGDYSEAETNFCAALNIWKNSLGEEHPEIAIVLSNIAAVYGEQGRYADAENIYSQVLEIQNRAFGDKHHDIWRTLNNIAALNESQGRYLEAENQHLSALAMIQSLFGDEHPDVAVSLNNIAALYDSQGRYLEAEKNYLDVLVRWRKLLGDEHPYVASTLNNIAENYKEQGRYLEAENIHLESLELRRLVFGEEHPDIASSLNNLGIVYILQGRYLEAETKSLEALAMRKRLFVSEHPDIAQSLNNLAVIYAYQGRYLEAEEKYLEALPVWEILLGKKHPDVANHASNLAALYKQQGRYSKAEQKYLEVLAIRKDIFGEQHPDVAISLNQLAEVYRQQGRYLEAEKVHLDALAMRKSLLGEQHPEVAASLNNLAVLYSAQFKHSQAESLFLQALEILRSIFKAEHPEIATTLNNLAVIYGYQGRYLLAEKMHLEVLRIKNNLLGEHPDIALSLNNLAEIYFSLGRYPEAEQRYIEALGIRKRLLGDEHPDVAKSLNNLATVLTATDRPMDALSNRIQASCINDKIIRSIFAFSSESDRLALIDKLRANFNLFLSLIHKHLSDSETARHAALDFILKRKALTVASLTAQNEALYSDRYPHLTQEFRQLSDLNTQLINLTFSTPESGDHITYQENLAKLQAQSNYLQKQLASKVPEIQLFEQPSNRYAVASALPADSILIEFVCFDVFDFHAVPANGDVQWHPSHYLAFILPAGQPNAVQMIDLGEAPAIDELIGKFRSQASDPATQTLAWGKVSRTPKLQIEPYNPSVAIELAQALLTPILDVIGDCKHLIFAPDGNLNLVPLQILPIDEIGKRLLMDEYTTSYLGVGRDILRSQIQTARPASPPLVIADPDFDLVDEQTDVAIAQNIPGHTWATLQQQFLNKQLLNTQEGRGLSRASGTRFLGESIAKKLKASRLYVGDEALETHLTASKCPNIIIIATHGLFLPNSSQTPKIKHEGWSMGRFSVSKAENPMMRSLLALAGANTWLFGGTLPSKAGKGFVFAQDIANLDLWANELAVLSACDTARGDIKIGEGVFGLQRAFAIAGSKTLVMSLWKVPGKVTALLMERFFDNLQLDMGHAEALQNAQNYIRRLTVPELQKSVLGREVLKELLHVNELSAQSKIDCNPDDTPLEHPFYWGAWICQGNITPLKY